MRSMDADRGRLATAIQRRREALGFTQVQLAKLAGVTDTTIRNLEGGRQFTRPPASLPAVEQALGWVPGSGQAVLNGGEPTLVADALAAEVEDFATRYEIEDSPDAVGDVGTIVRDTVFEVIGVLAPDTPLSQVRDIEALALEAVLRRGGRPLRRHPQAYQEPAEINNSNE
jgi:transcriptional regulator with XRE-family HTH domain